jgi:lipoyl(octanoyl) transferase
VTRAWSLIVEPVGRPGHEHMAVDHALLRAARGGAAVLRLYCWNPPCLSLGRNEPALERYDREAIDTLGLATVRRPTGGRAVWHAAEVTYAVAGPADLFGSLPATYRAIHDILATALRTLGVDAALAPHTGALSPGAGACFASPAGGEVIVGGRKLVGSAQVRDGGAFLQHGAILLEDGQDVVSRVTRGAAPPVLATSLGILLQRSVTFAEVSDAVAAAAMAAWKGTWTPAPPPHLTSWGRYADPEWTWRR